MAEIKGIPILISLDAQSTSEGQPEDTMRLITTGELFEKPGNVVIRYEETIDENEPAHKIEMMVQGNTITMNRQGIFDAKMVFQKGQRYESQYHTPYGDLDMALYCTKATYTRTRETGEIALQYQLDVSGQFAAVHDMKLHYIRKKDA